MPTWKLLNIRLENDEVLIEGRDVWRSHWHDTNEEPIMVPHPSYPWQTHKMWIYELAVIVLLHPGDIVGALRNQALGIAVGTVAQLLRDLADPLAGLFADVRIAVQGTRNRGDRQAELGCHILYRDTAPAHSRRSAWPDWFASHRAL